jgi:uncharacterized membrane protein YfcA
MTGTVTVARVVLGILSGFVAGAMGGAFGVGGAIVTTPAVQVLLGARPIVAVGTPLPAIFPTTLAGLPAYRRAGQIDYRAVRWIAPFGALSSAGGAALTQVIKADILLLVTALLIGYQAARLAFGTGARERASSDPPPAGSLAATGLVAGLTSGLLGVGGGIVMVPVMSGILRMPLKRVLGTSLVCIAFMVIPGTIVHALLGHIDWTICLLLSIGSVPGAALGSRWTNRVRERTLRIAVGILLGAVSIAYAGLEIVRLVRG